MEWSMRVIFCALGMSIAHEEKHFGDCDLWFIICCRLAVILPLIRRKFAVNSPLIRFFFAASSLRSRLLSVCFPFVFRYFPFENGEKTEEERRKNGDRTRVERRSNGEWTEVERRNCVWARDEQLVRSAYPWAFLLDFGYKGTAFLNTGYHLMPDNAG